MMHLAIDKLLACDLWCLRWQQG